MLNYNKRNSYKNKISLIHKVIINYLINTNLKNKLIEIFPN